VLVPGGGTLALTGYAGLDLLAPTKGSSLFGDSTTAFRFAWGNRVAGLAFTQPLGARAELVQRVAYSGYSTRYDDESNSVRLANSIRELRLAGEVTRRIGAGPAPARADTGTGARITAGLGADSGVGAPTHTLRAATSCCATPRATRSASPRSRPTSRAWCSRSPTRSPGSTARRPRCSSRTCGRRAHV
jgi:hypothetical protein